MVSQDDIYSRGQNTIKCVVVVVLVLHFMLCSISSLHQEGLSAEAVQVWLSSRGVNVSVSAITSNRTLYEAAGLQAVVRASVHVYNTEEEIQMLVNAVASMRERPPACVC